MAQIGLDDVEVGVYSNQVVQNKDFGFAPHIRILAQIGQGRKGMAGASSIDGRS